MKTQETILIYGKGLGWKRLKRHDCTKLRDFRFFVNNCRYLGYHLMCVDDESARGWGFETPEDLSSIETIEI